MAKAKAKAKAKKPRHPKRRRSSPPPSVVEVVRQLNYHDPDFLVVLLGRIAVDVIHISGFHEEFESLYLYTKEFIEHHANRFSICTHRNSAKFGILAILLLLDRLQPGCPKVKKLLEGLN